MEAGCGGGSRRKRRHRLRERRSVATAEAGVAAAKAGESRSGMPLRNLETAWSAIWPSGGGCSARGEGEEASTSRLRSSGGGFLERELLHHIHGAAGGGGATAAESELPAAGVEGRLSPWRWPPFAKGGVEEGTRREFTVV
ncbi:hypothetical protein ACP70R_029293 [Stipagrostis hirtigluma subsp. patula]